MEPMVYGLEISNAFSSSFKFKIDPLINSALKSIFLKSQIKKDVIIAYNFVITLFDN